MAILRALLPQELRHEIAIWQRAAASLSSYSKDENLVRETLLKKVQRLLSQLKKKLMTGSVTLDKYKTTLEELQEKVSWPRNDRNVMDRLLSRLSRYVSPSAAATIYTSLMSAFSLLLTAVSYQG